MKKQIFIALLFLISLSNNLKAQSCLGSNTTGTHNDCFLNTSQQANINRLNADSIINGTWCASTISIAYGGTGLGSIGTANQVLRVNSGGTALEYITPGYIVTETDPVFSTSPAANITSTDKTNWSTAYSWGNHSAAGYLVGADTLSLSNRINQKFNTPSGSAGQYLNGSGTPTLFPSIPAQVNIIQGTGMSITGTYPNITVARNKRQDSYIGTTNGSGDYTVTFGTSYSITPNIQANFIAGNDLQTALITSISTTGFTVKVVQRNTTTLLGIVVLGNTVTNVSGSTVHVLITEN
jgi:hypothetical protein